MRLGRARRPLLSTAASLLILSGLLPVAAPVAVLAAPTDLFISEYIEGSSNNKAIEIYNGTGAPVNLATGAYSVQMFFNGSATAGLTINLTGSVANGDVYVLAQSAANAAILAQADQTNGSGWFNGDDAVVLRKGTTVLDVIGQIGVDPGSEWGSSLTSTADNTLRRKATIQAGDPNGTDGFDPAGEWDGYASDTFDGLGAHLFEDVELAPAVVSSLPADGATNVARNATISLTFSEPVELASDGVSLGCSTSGAHPVTVGAGPTSWTIDPADDFAFAETCTLTVTAPSVTDVDASDPPDAMAVDASISFSTEIDTCTLTFTRIGAIQGSGSTVAMPGQVVAQGVVVGDYEGPGPAAGGMRGFYIQDPIEDGSAATSDGIFVFEPDNLDRVAVGDLVAVRGGAGENQGQSQITSTDIRVCGTGTIEPTPVSLPQPSTDWFERYEGMLVTFDQTLTVTETFQLGRFGQAVMSADGRQWTPTAVAEPGPDAQAVAAANALGRVIVDDHLMSQNPDPIRYGRNGNALSAANTLRIGDTATGITGLLGWTWAGNGASGNAWRVRPLGSLGATVPDFQPANPRPAPPAVGGSLHVGAMNVLNYFTTLDTTSRTGPCGPTGGQECRGANTSLELERQRTKILEAMAGLDADIIGLMEIQNDDDVAIADLVDGLRARTTNPDWEFIRTGPIGTDAIRVGIIYDSSVVMPAGAWAILDSGVDSRFLDTKNRPSLAQTFDAVDGGGRLTVVVNHLKSKGSDCLDVDDPDTGDGSGNCNMTRTQAARALVDWIASDPTNSGDRDVLVVGDLNSYAKEAPIDVFIEAGFENVIDRFAGADAYSYVFNGQTGYLDHALASPTLAAQLVGAADWHINADEPSVLDYNTEFKSAGQVVSLYSADAYRSSDHDPLVVGMNLLNYAFTGFEAPIEDAPTVNVVKAGASVPVKFQLSGDLGLDVLFGTPTANQYSCSSGSRTDTSEATTAGGSRLQYDPLTNTYTYVWKTEKAWADQCRTFEITFDDGSYRTALFTFTK